MKNNKIKTSGLVLMIISTIFGFANTTVAYEQMGYASIIWYVLAAVFFLLPSSLMFAEYGSTFKDAHGGSIRGWQDRLVKSGPLSAHSFGCLHGSFG